jgi:hypothetical protein
MIPDLDTDGNLPPGIHHATWTEIVTRYATSTRRRELLDGLLDALRSRYGGDLFPATWPAQADGTTYRDFFQRDRITKQPKGIIAIDLTGLP